MAALERVGRVGSELAAESLSRIIGRPLRVAASSATLLPFQKVPEVLGGPEAEVVGIYLAIHGAVEGRILLVIPADRAYALTHRMYEPGEVKDADSPRFRVGVTLVADVLAASLLSALSGTTRLPLYSTPTQTVTDMAGAISSQLLAEAGAHSENVLVYRCRFECGELIAEAHWLLAPAPASMNTILEALGV